MNWELGFYHSLISLGFLWLASVAWHDKRTSLPAKSFVVALVFAAFWAAGAAGQNFGLFFATQTQVIWVYAAFVFKAIAFHCTPLVLFMFALVYVGQRLNSNRFMWLAGAFSIVPVMIFMNTAFGFYATDFVVRQEILFFTGGLGLRFSLFYSLALWFGMAIFLLFRTALFSRVYQLPSIVVTLVWGVPILLTGLFNLGETGFDWGSVTLIIPLFGSALAILRWQFLRQSPAGYAEALENPNDALLVTNLQGELIDQNEAAFELFGGQVGRGLPLLFGEENIEFIVKDKVFLVNLRNRTALDRETRVWSAQDITELKKIQADLEIQRQNEEKQRLESEISLAKKALRVKRIELEKSRVESEKTEVIRQIEVLRIRNLQEIDSLKLEYEQEQVRLESEKNNVQQNLELQALEKQIRIHELNQLLEQKTIHADKQIFDLQSNVEQIEIAKQNQINRLNQQLADEIIAKQVAKFELKEEIKLLQQRISDERNKIQSDLQRIEEEKEATIALLETQKNNIQAQLKDATTLHQADIERLQNKLDYQRFFDQITNLPNALAFTRDWKAITNFRTPRVLLLLDSEKTFLETRDILVKSFAERIYHLEDNLFCVWLESSSPEKALALAGATGLRHFGLACSLLHPHSRLLEFAKLALLKSKSEDQVIWVEPKFLFWQRGLV